MFDRMPSVRQVLKQSNAVVGMVTDVRRLRTAIRTNKLVGTNTRLINRYLQGSRIRKLQIGAGPTVLDGWLSTDIMPRSRETLYLDATKRFPFEDGTFDYVYSEHMIEHVPWKSGLAMLRECRRILKPDGVVRVATPDLRVLLNLYAGTDEPIKDRYVKWVTDNFLEEVDVYRPAFVINNAFENWGHQFLYDAELMTMALRRAGFGDISQWAPGESNDDHLRAIESHGKSIADDDVAVFETMVFEARPCR